MIIENSSLLWRYLGPEMRSLAQDGEFLIADSVHHTDPLPTDFSYLVFPFAKLYEGFLKQLFVDLRIISDRDFRSDRFRIGRTLSPNLVRVLGSRSAYGHLEQRFGAEVPATLWRAWKEGRNLIFHYFQHNMRSLTRDQAIALVDLLVRTMSMAVERTHVRIIHAPETR